MPLKVGDTAPDLELPAVEGDRHLKIKLSDFRGKKNVVVSFHPLDWTPDMRGAGPGIRRRPRQVRRPRRPGRGHQRGFDSQQACLAEKRNRDHAHAYVRGFFSLTVRFPSNLEFCARSSLFPGSVSAPCLSWIRWGRLRSPGSIRSIRRQIMRNCWQRSERSARKARPGLHRKVRKGKTQRSQRTLPITFIEDFLGDPWCPVVQAFGLRQPRIKTAASARTLKTEITARDATQ